MGWMTVLTEVERPRVGCLLSPMGMDDISGAYQIEESSSHTDIMS